MLKVMTPLLGTKTPSAPVWGKSGGDRRAARSLLSCALWRGMGRLWRGMGGMGRPEPLSAHRPHRQQGLSGFHETRDPRQGVSLARRAGCPLGRREFQGFHETRNTNHGFFSPWMHKGRTIRNRRLDRRARRPIAAFLRVVVRHGAAMARHGRHGRPEPLLLCSRLFGIVQQKILHLSQCPLSVHTGNAAFKVLNETRLTKRGLCGRSVRYGSARVASRKTAARLLFACARSRGLARHRVARGAPELLSAHRPHQPHGRLGFHETCNMVFPSPSGDSKESNPKPRQRVFANHETRDTAFAALRFAVGAPCGDKADLKVTEPKPKSVARTAAP